MEYFGDPSVFSTPGPRGQSVSHPLIRPRDLGNVSARLQRFCSKSVDAKLVSRYPEKEIDIPNRLY